MNAILSFTTRWRILFLSLTCFVALTAGCGGGSAGSTTLQPQSPQATTITSVSLNPNSASVMTSGTQQFVATVTGTGTFNTAVTWSVNGTQGGSSVTGTISSAGLYVAPGAVPVPSTVAISATSVEDQTKSGSAQATITTPVPAPTAPPTITSISPMQGAPGDEIQISGSGLGVLVQTVVFSGPSGLTIPTLVEQGSPTALRVRVPLETASGPVFMRVTDANGNVTNSNSLPFTRLPDLRIRAPQNDLAAGESESFKVVFFGTSTPEAIVWSAQQGSISSDGTYIAPSSLQSDTFDQVTACIQGSQTCDYLLLGLHPFRVGPTAPVVSLGNTLQMEELTAGMPVSSAWSQVTGGGVLSNSGLYTASSAVAEGGSTVVAASYQGIQEQASIGVTGGFPGLVNRVFDYLNLASTQIQRVTRPLSVATSGNRAYVLAAQGDSGSLKVYYIDVYDITDPVHPLWLSAVEAAAAGRLHVFGSILYDINPNGIGGFLPSAMAAYDVSGVVPVLITRRPLPQLFSWSFYAGVFTASEISSHAAGASALIDQFSLVGSNLTEQQIALPPAMTGAAFAVAAVAATQNRLYVTEMNTSSTAMPGILAEYDITINPAKLLSTVSLPETQLSADAIIGGPYLCTDQKIFDITKEPPSLAGGLPEGLFELSDATSNKILGRSLQNGLRVIDVSNPENPQTVQSLFDFVDARQMAALAGNYLYSAEVSAGLAVYDVSVAGGPRFADQLIVNDPPNNVVAATQVASSTNLFAAGCGSLDCEVFIFALQNPQVPQAIISTGATQPNALSLAANDLYVGTDQSLLIFDVTPPTQPTQVGSISTPINALTTSSGFLYAGTKDNRLLAYNVAAPGLPVLTTSVSLPDLAVQMTTRDNLLLVADGTGGLLVFDVSTPSQPTLISQLTVPPAVLGVQVDGNLALLAALETGLVIADLSAPSSPRILSQTGLDSIEPFEPGLSQYQNRAAVIANRDQIAFIGVSNFDPNGLNNGDGMVYGFDYRQPQHPRLVSLAAYANQTAGWISSMCFAGVDLFVGGFGVGLIELDAGQPRNTINLYYPPKALSPAPLPPSSLSVIASIKNQLRQP